jgi:hypothetical protein
MTISCIVAGSPRWSHLSSALLQGLPGHNPTKS